LIGGKKNKSWQKTVRRRKKSKQQQNEKNAEKTLKKKNVHGEKNIQLSSSSVFCGLFVKTDVRT
jgi:hypothetical protein